FPVRYGDEWDVVLTNEFGGGLNIDSMHFFVDAWGTIIDAVGEHECLRIQTFTQTLDVNGEEIETETDWTYSWVVANYGGIVNIESEENEEDPNFSSGVFIRTTGINEVGVSDRPEFGIPTNCRLEPAYPNPFNSQTRINYHLQHESFVELVLCDISGREVMKLFSGVRPAGEWSATVDARNLVSGIYLLQMNAGDYTTGQKIVVVK
ncbi:MAG: T9SS type A sorting domain-containing protein, partial [Candidatus Electryoneaceae bacterium]|nr:T9SS type A sorting domain-containing protein [Candidatus Electryoneaceae bacterium]